MALQISKQVRPRLDLEQESWFIPGKVRLPDVRAARLLAWRVNEALGESERERAGVSGGAMRALDLIEEALQRIARHYLKTRDPSLIRHAREGLAARLGQASLDETLKEFNEEYLGGSPISSDEAVLELLILWILQNNPAARSITRVLHESPLLERPQFQQAVESLTGLLEAEELPGTAGGERLLDLLLGPQRASPDSLLGQLQFLLRQWGELLADYRSELQAGLDLFAEELAPRFAGGPGPAEAPALSFGDDDQVRYSSDRNWMPSLVLLAKNVYVWLDQLSKRYGTPMRHLDEIPDAELAGIAARGISGLWLIGVWERSIASQRVKQMCGNPEAVASAYSLRRYKIADELGGEAALQRLEKKAWDHGVRLAADMVPNHMGIDSDWVLEHPDWFLGGAECPFPSYSFDGPDFSPDPSVGIYLEDHYFDRSDAAVVFKRVDHETGEARFIYHGNDGTSMPWNDTAQLDYLDPRVREAVLETILDVARRFPVIRFDAAMTLTKRHYQRLWFPEPGTAGAIPSRAEHGMTREAFKHRMPEEFWREVVDRVSTELPDTLLLAEAFWLMEGYFVRTLGMHRVYNSAFMNMLRDQENDKYRRLLKETLEFDPQILQRYVNFMSNPDEQTAMDQFGKEDRYFGVCVLMATLPGLPMFAHGQFEGFAEKYGMEYRRAYWEEEADAGLIARHEREIVPLLKRRHLFAGVDNFRLYDVIDDGGGVNEDVYALSNGVG
ncbi:MAG: alpha-amylase family glycosyl hydrolase, partial [Thermoanaerobaculia bacterium]